MLKFADGREITAGNFEEWRQETKAIFEEYAYGKIPTHRRKQSMKFYLKRECFALMQNIAR